MESEQSEGGRLFSILIATTGRPTQLKRCVEAIGALNFPRDLFELVIVFDGGDGVPEEVLQGLAGDATINVLHQPNRGPSAARNAAAAAASGRFFTFVDDDCVPAADWLDRLRLEVEAHPDSMTGGRTVNTFSNNVFSETSQTVVEYLYVYYNSPDAGRRHFFASNNMTVPRTAFRSIGGFDEMFRAGEDREFCASWQAAGHKSNFAQGVVMHHAHDLNLLSFQRQHFTYGRGAFAYWRKHASANNRGMKVEPLSFYTGLMRYPFVAKKHSPVVQSALIVLAQIANVAGFAFESLLQATKGKRRAAANDGYAFAPRGATNPGLLPRDRQP